MNTRTAAERNRAAWDSFRRQRDEGLVGGRRDVAARLAAGESFLHPAYTRLLGDVAGKRLLDLGCGDGAELLSWARLGATVVGVDNSPRQLDVAQQGAAALGLGEDRCRAVLADLLQLPEALLLEEFDAVVSIGVSSWIGDLERWFADACRALKPGGVFLLSALHSLSAYYGARLHGDGGWTSYFDEGPFVERLGSDGAHHRWNPANESLTTVQWMHTLGHVLTAMAQAGLRVTHVVELPEEASGLGVPVLHGGPAELIVRATKDAR